MSEFQQYQFKTIDQPLSPQQVKRISALSSRSHVTSTSATFVYHYSDFRGNPVQLMIDDFDAMFYIANWGTKRLMFRFPLDLIDKEAILQYAIEPPYSESSIEFHLKKNVLVLDFTINNDGGDGWIEEDDFDLGDFIPLRDNIINGDYRMLYLAWLKIATESVDFEMEEDEDQEDTQHQPIPLNLKKRTSPLTAFINSFEIDEDIISAAANKSQSVSPQQIDYKKLLTKLPKPEREDFLNRLLEGEARLDLKLRKRLEKFMADVPKKSAINISLTDLSKQAKVEEGKRLKKEKKIAQKKHEKRMQKIAKEENMHWKSVQYNMDRKTGKSYDLATTSLKDLSDMYIFYNKQKAFQLKMSDILKRTRSPALLDRFKRVGLI